MADRDTALILMDPAHTPLLFPRYLLDRLSAAAEILGPVGSAADPTVRDRLGEVSVLITGWGSPVLDETLLAAMPRLRAVLHAAGTVKHLVPAQAWERGLVVSSAADANAIPVAEFTLAAILLAGKGAFGLRERYRATGGFTIGEVVTGVGNYGTTVGVVGASRIGQQVISLLAPHDVRVQLHDPYTVVPGVPSVSLPDLLATSRVVSLHAPWTAETDGMIGREALSLMPDGAVLVNTARGGLVDTPALIAELRTGRISAVLDVTHPEPVPADSPLLTLPNVFLTPHIAGSHGNELERLGASVTAELERIVAGSPLRHEIRHRDLDHAA